MMSGGDVPIEPARPDLDPFHARARYTSSDFFAMFRVPMRHGGAWSPADDEKKARVAVISKELNEKLYGGENSVGRPLRLGGTEFRIIGVLGYWRPTPHFYDLNTGSYSETEQVFLPISTSLDLKLSRSGSMNCWDDGSKENIDNEALNAPCTWIQYWVELGSARKAAAYKEYLVRYSDEQRKLGRYERPTNVRLRNLMQWLDYNKVVPSDVRLQTYLAFGFFLVCLINTIGLLLAKFLRRSPEIGVRRALGASKRAIFTQLVIEAGTIGLAGGVLGLGLAWLGLWAVRHQPTEYASLAELDVAMFVTTFALALVASILAGLVPAWRACHVAPAAQLKSQ
jgi:putative ABC transport system permease protein